MKTGRNNIGSGIGIIVKRGRSGAGIVSAVI